MVRTELAEIRRLVDENREIIKGFIDPDYLLAKLQSIGEDLKWGIRQRWIKDQAYQAEFRDDQGKSSVFIAEIQAIVGIIVQAEKILQHPDLELDYVEVFQQGILPIDIIGDLLGLELKTTNATKLQRLADSLTPLNTLLDSNGPSLDLIKQSLNHYVVLRKRRERV
ncbi:hypothetical protein KBD71_02465 [Candidatus Woesebacteria bacterium]|nr:hypothetical protein [Candidatus Woesebacteria bacterium]